MKLNKEEFNFLVKYVRTETPSSPETITEPGTALVQIKSKQEQLADTIMLILKNRGMLNNREINTLSAKNINKRLRVLYRKIKPKPEPSGITEGGVRVRKQFIVKRHGLDETVDISQFTPIASHDGVIKMYLRTNPSGISNEIYMIDAESGKAFTYDGPELTDPMIIIGKGGGIMFELIDRLVKSIRQTYSTYMDKQFINRLKSINKQFKTRFQEGINIKSDELIILSTIFKAKSLEDLQKQIGPVLFDKLISSDGSRTHKQRIELYNLFYTPMLQPLLIVDNNIDDIKRYLSIKQLEAFKLEVTGQQVPLSLRKEIAAVDLILTLKLIDSRNSSQTQTYTRNMTRTVRAREASIQTNEEEENTAGTTL